MRLKLLSILTTMALALIFSNSSYGQLRPQNSLYLIDLYQLNPAYGGLERSLNANFNYRDQWSGFDQNPVQLNVNAHLPLYLFNGGAGFSLQSDKLGGLSMNSFKVSYNNIKKTAFGIISGGLGLGFTSTRLDGSVLLTPEGFYENNVTEHNDPILISEGQRGNRLDYDLGIFIGMEALDVSISFSNLFLPKFNVQNINIKSPNIFNLFIRKPLFIRDLIFLPSLLIKSDFISTQTDVSCLIKSGSVFGGLSLRGYSKRSLDSIVFLGGIKINTNYTLSYSYDAGISSLRSISQGVHEVNVSYNLNKLIGVGLPPEIIYNPRNL